jgi:FkbM family methyltransferase
MPPLVSYAQYGEDLVLWSALSDIENGFYIDVGAADPMQESVTRLFYTRGWHGINIEPRKSAHQELCIRRPRDINLRVLAGSTHGTMTLYEIADQRGLSTTVASTAEEYRDKGMSCLDYEVRTVPLAAICEEYAPRDVHFLKIDVEGAERAVLEGCDFRRFRPWILAIESTYPCTYRPTHDEWEHIVLGAGYILALAHQINRYYVAKEHAGRAALIRAPDL